MHFSLLSKLTTALVTLLSFSTEAKAAGVQPEYLSIKVTDDYQIQVDIPPEMKFDYLYAFQLNVPRTFAWNSSISQFYQCTSDTDCTLLTGDDVSSDGGDMYQFSANIQSPPADGTYLRFVTPSLSFPNYGVFPVSFMIYLGGDNPQTLEYVTTIYKLNPASSDLYTYIPTTTCVGQHCYSTSIPEIKETKTTIVDGKTSLIHTYSTISYEPVTVQSTQTVTTMVVETGTLVVTTYCPITDTSA